MPLSCKDCGDPLTKANCRYTGMMKASTGEKYMDNICKPCSNRHTRVLRTLHKQHPTPPPGSKCDCCGRIAKLFLDHCHVRLTFRGYLCQACNHGLGQLGDCEEGLAKALAYLKQANARDTAPEAPKVEQRTRKPRSGGTLQSFEKGRARRDKKSSSINSSE